MSLETARDIAVIIVAVESIVLLLIFIFIAWKVYGLIRMTMSKIDVLMGKVDEFSALGQGVIKSAQHTADTAAATATSMKGSAEFVSDTMVSPVVQVVSAVAGARGFVSALFRLSSRHGDGGSK